MRPLIGVVLVAAADVTGVPVTALMHSIRCSRAVRRHRWCAHAAAIRLGHSRAAVARRTGRPNGTIPRATTTWAEAVRPDVIEAIVARARELTAAAAPPAPVVVPPVTVATVLAAASDTLRVPVAALVGMTVPPAPVAYRRIARAAAWQLGVPRQDVAAAWGVTPHAVTGRRGCHDRTVATYPDHVAAVIRRAVERARQEARDGA